MNFTKWKHKRFQLQFCKIFEANLQKKKPQKSASPHWNRDKPRPIESVTYDNGEFVRQRPRFGLQPHRKPPATVLLRVLQESDLFKSLPPFCRQWHKVLPWGGRGTRTCHAVRVSFRFFTNCVIVAMLSNLIMNIYLWLRGGPPLRGVA